MVVFTNPNPQLFISSEPSFEFKSSNYFAYMKPSDISGCVAYYNFSDFSNGSIYDSVGSNHGTFYHNLFPCIQQTIQSGGRTGDGIYSNGDYRLIDFISPRTGNLGVGANGSNQQIAQSFIMPRDDYIWGINCLRGSNTGNPSGTSQRLKVFLTEDNNGVPGNILGSKSFTNADIITTGVYQKVWWMNNNPLLTSGTKYWIHFTVNNLYSGSYFNIAYNANGSYGTCMQYDGAWKTVSGNLCLSIDTHDEVRLNSQIQLVPSGHSISFWVKYYQPADVGDVRSIMANGSGASAGYIQLYNGSQLKYESTTNNTYELQVNIPNVMDNNWHHICNVSDSNSYRVYVDGKFARSGGPLNDTVTQKFNRFFTFGGTTYGMPYNGYADEFAFYNKALTQEEIDILYHLGSNYKFSFNSSNNPIFQSSSSYETITPTSYIHYKLNDNATNNIIIDSDNNLDATFENNSSSYTSENSIIGKINNAINFDGTSTCITMDEINNIGELTISLWFKLNNESKEFQYIIGSHSDSTGPLISLAYVGGESKYLNFFAHVPTRSVYRYIHASGNYFDNQWHHCVCTRTLSGITTIYIDGIDKTILDIQTGDISGAFSTGHSWYIGRNPIGWAPSPSNHFEGGLDDVRLYKKVLSLSEILQLYNNGLGTEDDISTTNFKPIIIKDK